MKKMFLLTLVLCLIFIFAFFIQNPRNIAKSGYCNKTGNNISDQELIEIAVKKEYAKIDFENEKLSHEDHIKNFQKNHRNCCDIERENDNVFGKIFGNNFFIVNMYFKRNLTYSDPHGSKYYEAHVEIQSCGEIKNEYGTSIDEKDLPIGKN